MTLNDSTGSLWRKWDLHVHTPESIVQNYRGWEEFLVDLESLPQEFAVLGINDYLFLDGYKRILNDRKKGRLTNIANVLPVIELRLNTFGGTESKLRRVNLHVIFSEELDPDVIDAQFLSAIASSYRLSPDYEDSVEWNNVITRESLEDLGRQIKQTVPPEELPKFGSDFQEGFNNLTVSMEEVLKILERPLFKDKARIGVGNTEWSAIKWNQQSIADKKTIINDADLVFVASESPAEWAAVKRKLEDSSVNSRLFDCSDAHHHANEQDKDRIGNCFTWINADPTFDGLRHAIHEYDNRVFVGDLPEKLRAVEAEAGRFISTVEVHKDASSTLSEPWFDFDLTINPGFVAVIGNRGMGKSALVDVLGLLGSSPNQDSFSFLNKAKFKHPRGNKAKEFTGTISWRSGDSYSRNLDALVEPDEVARVRYLPQSLLESLCNEDPTESDSGFERELEEVIFSHVPPSERLGCDSLESLVEQRAAPVEHLIEILRGELSDTNSEIASVEEQLAPDNLAQLKNRVQLKELELSTLEGAKPVEVAEPPAVVESDSATVELLSKLEAAQGEKVTTDERIEEANTVAEDAARREAAANRVLREVENLQRLVETFGTNVKDDLALLGIDLVDVAELTTGTKKVESLRDDAALEKSKAQLLAAEDEPGSLGYSRQLLELAIDTFTQRLDAPRRMRAQYLQKLRDWQEQKEHLVGDIAMPGSINALKESIKEYETLPDSLAELKQIRLGKVSDIHKQLLELRNMFREVYQPVQQFIRSHPLAANHFDLEFDASLAVSGLADRLLEGMINRAVSGSFSGIDEADQLLDERTRSSDFNDTESVVTFVTWLDDALHRDVRQDPPEENGVKAQLRQGVAVEDVYNIVFSLDYLKPRYLLQSKGKPLSQLSPGEKGTLLLMFYLLIDRDNIPIIVDQPEENLDSQTLFDLLAPAIKEARTRRQVILVTHSANLAVVGDADQVIVATLNNKTFSYESGSIENPAINAHILDILEGTGRSFADRGKKYHAKLEWGR